MTISEVRRQNFALLIEQYGGQSGLAKASSKAPAYISQLASGVRNLGEASTRNFESALGLPRGWFDIARTPASTSVSFPVEAWDSLSPHARSLVLNVVEFFRVSGSASNEEEASLLASFRKCSPEAKRVVLAVAAAQAVAPRKQHGLKVNRAPKE